MLLETAYFIRRINRFTIECQMEGNKALAYLPNPGRLWEILIPGRILYLSKRGKGLPYTVWAALRHNTLICLNTLYINEVAEFILKGGFIEDLKDFKVKGREYKIDKHRIDFLLENNSRSLPLEVKSCTLFHENIAMFPDAVTERGRLHLETLVKNKGGILFIVNFPHAEFFLPDFHTDPNFSEALSKNRNNLLIKAISVNWKEDMSFEYFRELKIPWDIYDKEAMDKGAYLICGRLSKGISLRVGSLGNIYFKAGYYVYVGSAMNSLLSRVKRHLSLKKTKRWHIDYFIPSLERIKAIPIRSSISLECALAKALDKIAHSKMPNFGCSDCNCMSHLFWFRKNPFEQERFIEIILNFRIGRLRGLIEKSPSPLD